MASEFAGGGTRTRPAERPLRAAVVGLRALGLALASCGAAAAATGDAASPWETRCETPPGAASEQCAIIQSVVDDQRPNITLVIIALKTADHKSRLLRVIAPLGVLLPTGLDLKLDADDVGRMGFVRCLPNGCVAETLHRRQAAAAHGERADDDARPVSNAGGRHRRAGAHGGIQGRVRQIALRLGGAPRRGHGKKQVSATRSEIR